MKFPLNQVLTITTGRLVCDMGDVYKILNYLTGDNLFTHQLPRAMEFCQPQILEQYPELRDVPSSGVTSENWREWLEEMKSKLPAEYELSPLEGWDSRNPIEEAEEMIGKEKVITVVTP